ncbi:uncharacterized protein G2W53_003098 [Senna tora]|uniref:Uncharacterized protein n=1 Tax=Senna tora TaxID=362788 RepID=A0A834X9Y3_9FABA|nr:uncharacterized protein G2W53_003098 [Senna tora]
MANTYHGLPLEVSANVSGINPPGFPPHFVFPLINGLSEEISVGVSTDPNFSLTAIIGSAKISLRNVVSHGGCTESSYLRKGSDNNR